MRGILALLLSIVLVSPAPAHEPGHGRRGEELGDLATRIVGGASLLVDLDPGRATRAFHDHAHRFEEGLRNRGFDARAEWRRVRESFEDARRAAARGGGRSAFLLVHLAEDLEAADPLVAGLRGAAGDGERRQYAFLLTEECVGTNRAGKRPCPAPRRELSFRIPHRVAKIHRIVGEWRDYGRSAKPQVLVDGQVVWTASAKSGWDTDGKSLSIPVRRRSVLTLRSENGDPLWVRRLEIEYEEAPGR